MDLWIAEVGDLMPEGFPSDILAIEGYQWEVWTDAEPMNIPTFTYWIVSGADGIELDLMPFIEDAVWRDGALSPSHLVVNIQAGFAIWAGGAGLKCDCFWVDIS